MLSDFSHIKATVVGSGVFGSAIALDLARRGAQVTIIDARPLAQSASGVAAGMLAPALETALDKGHAGGFNLLARARDLWPAFVDGIGPTGLERCGALMRAPAADLDRIGSVLSAQDAAFERVGEALYTPEDWRLEARLTLAAMRRALLQLGGVATTGEVVAAGATSVRLSDGTSLASDIVVLACGFGGRNLAPELAVLTPIKGQLLLFPEAGISDGPILRSLLGYVVPTRAGVIAGATMEEGASDISVDPDVSDRLRVEATWLAPSLALAHANGFAGVRAATPDGLPMIGRSSNGVWLAAGARRNGWLLAPLAADVLRRSIAAGTTADEPLFSPARF